ncbi:MAG: hypothetical protein JJE18_02975 [Eubacteriaceae bacterium]|nr:hypothetical protein [Eubacteriaceae bacterium]
MYQNEFETLALEVTFISRKKMPDKRWQEMSSYFIEKYVEQLEKAEKVVIGHIKGLLELENNNFIKLSCIRYDLPINSEILKTGGSSLEGHLTFNAIISGLNKEKSIQYFQMALERTCSVYELMTDYNEHAHSNTKDPGYHGEKCPVCHEHHTEEKCEHSH